MQLDTRMLRLYGDSRVSRAQLRIKFNEILLQHDWLLMFSRQNRFAETHSHLQLSYHITDRLLPTGNDMQTVNYKVAVVFQNRIHGNIQKTSKEFALTAPMNVKL